MNSFRLAPLCFVVALVLAPLPARAQQGGNNARMAALEAAVAALQNSLSAEASARATADSALQTNINNEVSARTAASTALNSRVAKLEGFIKDADLVGTYRLTALISGTNANPASVGMAAFFGTATLAADHTGTFQSQGSGAQLVEGSPWTSSALDLPFEEDAITWSYADGLIHISDGTVNLDTYLNVGVGGRILTFAGLGDDGDVDLVILTRLR